MKVLVAEDNHVTRKMLETILASYGEVVVAQDGEEAFEHYCDAHSANKPFDLILLDIMMPNVSGHEALSAIRDYEEQLGIIGEQGVKVIVLSGCCEADDLFQAKVSGCTAYLTKPFDRRKLVHELMRLGLIAPSSV